MKNLCKKWEGRGRKFLSSPPHSSFFEESFCKKLEREKRAKSMCVQISFGISAPKKFLPNTLKTMVSNCGKYRYHYLRPSKKLLLK